jgi:hypothetical protein
LACFAASARKFIFTDCTYIVFILQYHEISETSIILIIFNGVLYNISVYNVAIFYYHSTCYDVSSTRKAISCSMIVYSKTYPVNAILEQNNSYYYIVINIFLLISMILQNKNNICTVGKYKFSCTRCKTGQRLAFLPVSKAHANKFYIC